MRENMLLQYADDIVKVEMGSLRGEILRLVGQSNESRPGQEVSYLKAPVFCSWLRFVAQYGGTCGVAVETAGRRMATQLEVRLRESLERLKLGDHISAAAAANSVGNSNHLEAMLQQLVSAARTQSSRLAKLETSCFSNPVTPNSKSALRHPEGGGAGYLEQDVTSQEAVLEGALAALQQAKVELEEVVRSSRRSSLPAGTISISVHLPPSYPVSSFFVFVFMSPMSVTQTSSFCFFLH